MKYLSLIFLFFIGFATQAQIVNIPDANFKNTLVNLLCVDLDGDGNGDVDADTNDDGEIQVSEAEAVIRLNVSGQHITSLVGIESFVNLEELNSQANDLTSINLSNCPNLITLWCGQNFLTELDLSSNLNITNVLCNAGPLAEINVTQNPSLSKLWVNVNELTTLDVSQNPNLTELVCLANNLITLDVSNNPNLEYLSCRNNQLISLDVSNNPDLIVASCQDNMLTELNLSQNAKLERIFCSNNQLTSLDLKNGNNEIIMRMFAEDNPNLSCIQVDDMVFANDQVCDTTNNVSWCKDATAQYSENCALGISSFNTASVVLSPNPVRDQLRISGDMLIEKVRVYSLQGSLISVSTTAKVDVSQLTPGLYFAEITTEAHRVVKKFVKL